MDRKIIFFVNPISGRRSKTYLEQKISIRCTKAQVAFTISETNKDGDYSFLKDRIQTEGITDVVICGGDGSIGPIVSGILNTSVNVGIIPLGSGNGLARTAGIPYSIDKALEIVITGKPQKVDAFRVNGRLGCQIAGMGFDAFIAQEFANERKRGLSTYTKLAVKHFFKARPYHFRIEYDGKVINTEAFIVCASNANQFGNNLKIAPLASLSDGLLDIVILNKATKMQILISFIRHLLFPKESEPLLSLGRQKKVQYFNTKKVTIRNTDKALMHIDGDPAGVVDNCTIEIMPDAYKLIHPAH